MEHNTLENFGLDLKIASYEEMSLSDGHNAFIIYIIIDNKTSSSRKVNVSKATYITNKKEQLEQDNWLSGYLIAEDTIYPNSFKKAGLVFYKSKLKKISNSDRIFIKTVIEEEGIEALVSFINEDGIWKIIEFQTTKIQKEIIVNPKQLEKHLLGKIERLEVFEEKFGVSIRSLSVKYGSEKWFRIFYELHPLEGTSINNRICIECVCYDNEGFIIFKTSDSFNPKDFFGFEVVQIYVEPIEVSRVSKIRIYPKN